MPRPKGGSSAVKIKISAEDSLAIVELVSEKETIWQDSFVEKDINLNVSLGEVNKDTHYYLRARERGDGIIYASPVFVQIEE